MNPQPRMERGFFIHWRPMAKRLDRHRITGLFTPDPTRQLTVRGIMRLLGLSNRDRNDLEVMLRQMAAEGALRLVKGRRYAANAAVEELVGVLSVHRDGYGFVTPEGARGKGQDIFLPARQLRAAMHGDRVVVQVVRAQRDGRREGRLLRVLERGQRHIVGIFRDQGRNGMVFPDDPRLGQPLKVPWGEHGQAQDGELVVAQIDTYATRGQAPLAKVLEVLGDPDEPWVEVRAQARRYQLPDTFTPQLLDAAENVAREVTVQDLAGRVDLRGLPLVTIDGADAKDFDDAVCAVEEDGGRIRAWVAIADVAHYVAAGSPLDREAWQRGNSVYFPGACLPMLPEALSNGICSLKPEVERLVMVAEMLFDGRFQRLESKIYPGVMCSRARLTYTQAQQYLDAAGEIDADVESSLNSLAELARGLMLVRSERGSLELDIPEAKVILDEQGRALSVVRGVRLFAHHLIEELMLAANEAVADYLTERNVPLLYRVHDPPAALALEPLRQVLRGLDSGESLPEKVTPAALQQVMRRFHETPQAEIVSHVILRCLQQARYDAENTGHFGLASSCYCHFTSPIRRYPDLVVHRAIKQHQQNVQVHDSEWLVSTAEQSSATERRAMEAERDLVALKGCQVMQRHIGEEFAGKVASVAPFGLFVELDEIYVEGLLALENLQDDSYGFDEQRLCLIGAITGREIHLGDRLQVQVAAVRCDRREIDFVPEGFTRRESVPPRNVRNKPYKRRGGRQR